MAENPLGKSTDYQSHYAPELLFPILRSEKRDELDGKYLDFSGEDIWNAYELSWLNNNGLPRVAIAEFRIPADTPYIVESKSLKLYLNSFNQTRFKDKESVKQTIVEDLSKCAQGKIRVELFDVDDMQANQISQLAGECIDDLSVTIDEYDYNASLLKTDSSGEVVSEVLISHLLKSNCLITSQPDWASVMIKYEGSKICRASLLKYLVSFRSHNEFHEQCVERIFNDLKKFCAPSKLTVYARYTRRGGLDINPWRSDFEITMPNCRLSRQ